jgi:hypothetical protein
MPPTKTRIVGSGFTTFRFMSNPIGFLDEIQDSGQAPISQYQAVTPLGDYFPREFAFPRVKVEGTLTFTIRELWNQPAWWQMAIFAGTYNIIDVYNVQSTMPVHITCSTIVRKPADSPAGATKDRGWTYTNTNLVTIDDREVVQIGALTMPRVITAVYANKLYFPSSGFAAPGSPLPPLTNNQTGTGPYVAQFSSDSTASGVPAASASKTTTTSK